jgi:cytoskeletal protein CcmA (bactofilin family)
MSLFGSGGRKQEERPDPSVRQRTETRVAATDSPESPPHRTDASERSHTGEAMANLGKSIVFKGDLSGDEDLEIEGRVEGQVELPNHQVTIGAHGRVAAQVNAKNVVVVGHVSGDVFASERVEVQASGVVDGDIHAPRLLIQEGAVVNGKIEMGGVQPKSEAPSPGEAQHKGEARHNKGEGQHKTG